MNKILIIEDDKALREELSVLLTNAGYETAAVTDFTNVAAQMEQCGADLILLDITLPDTNGQVLLQNFRKSGNANAGATPIIMLTSRTSELDEVLSMSYGADDYITKPYNPAILLLRISAVLRRTVKASPAQMYHDVQVNLVKGLLERDGCEQALTKNETIIFQLLFERLGEIVTRDELMTALWDNEEFINDNALTVCISRLRGKLAKLGLVQAIETRKKQGYRLQ